jgi:hypothetical protein
VFSTVGPTAFTTAESPSLMKPSLSVSFRIPRLAGGFELSGQQPHLVKEQKESGVVATIEPRTATSDFGLEYLESF